MHNPTVLIVGASRGLGLALSEEFCRRAWTVIATVRGPSSQLDAARAQFPGQLEEERVDITDEASVRALKTRLAGRRLDMLFVNAGIARAITESAGNASEQDFLEMMSVNAFCPMRFIEIFDDLVIPQGVIAAMSSELGSIANNDGYWDLYASSKAALNMLMKGYSARHAHDARTKLVVAPGWIQTEMGGAEATYTIEETIPLVVDMLEANCGRRGFHFLDRFGVTLPW